jgi:hypothetical protein
VTGAPHRRVAAALLLVLTWAATASARPELAVPPGLEAAWADYLRKDAVRKPGRDFPHAHCFHRAAAVHGIPLTLLLAVARGESDFDARAVSTANAIGVMQILWPVTARHLGIDDKALLFDPCTNIDAGARYLAELIERYDGDLHRALAAYNYGPGRVPTGDGPIPRGARWYSGYVFRHLGYVMETAEQAAGGEQGRYVPGRRLRLISFSTPYRAAAFVDELQRRAPTLRLDWFREHHALFHVVLTYSDAAELAARKRALRAAGFTPG